MVMMLLWDYDKLGHLADLSHGNDDVRISQCRNTQIPSEIHKHPQRYTNRNTHIVIQLSQHQGPAQWLLFIVI